MQERVGEGKTAFLVTDRRGERKAPREEAPVATVDRKQVEASKDKSRWKDVAYLIVQAQAGPEVVVNVLRAVGERSDGRPFVADWIMPPFWTDRVDLLQVGSKNAKDRLDTFLNCNCLEGNPCFDHRESIPLWNKLDSERVTRLCREPMPSSLELVMRAEQSRAEKTKQEQDRHSLIALPRGIRL